MKNKKEKNAFFASLENFWYYYKWPFIGGIVFFFAVLIAMTSLSDMSDPTDVDVKAVFARPLTTQEFEFQSRLKDVVSDTDGNGTVFIGTKSYYISEEGKSTDDELAKNQFEAEVAYAKGDLILMDRTNMERFDSHDLWEPLTDYMDISNIPPEDIYYRGDVAIGVRLSDSKLLLDMQFVIDNVYAGILFVPEGSNETIHARRESAANMIKELIKK